MGNILQFQKSQVIHHQLFHRRWESNTVKTPINVKEITSTPQLIESAKARKKIRIRPMEPQILYRYLKLKTYSEDEFDLVFDRIVAIPLPPNFVDINPTSNIHGQAHNNLQKTRRADTFLTQDIMFQYILQRIREEEAEENKESYSSENPTLNNEDDLLERERQEYAHLEVQRFWKQFEVLSSPSAPSISSSSIPTDSISRAQFRKSLQALTETVEYSKTLPITISMLLVGTSVGILSPVMPFIVDNLGLSAGQYGYVVSAFALAKIGANVPSAVLVERHGRKPYMVHSLSLIALGTGGIGFAYTFEQLYLCRFLVGLGVAALSSASTLTMADLSNPKNRAQTMAPILSAFAAGTALGPAIGGYLADEIGIHATFHVVGVSFLTMTAVNQLLLTESKPDLLLPWQRKAAASQIRKGDDSIWNAMKTAFGQWTPLLSNSSIRNVVILNGFYWVALAGGQMTLLPLFLTDPDGLAMTATEVGQVYMGMSLVQVLGNPLAAKFVDRWGKVPAMVGGCTLISGAMAALPLAAPPEMSLGYLALSLGIWSTGSTILSTAPVAFLSDRTAEGERAQALALLRTSGDVGFLVGASAVGFMANVTGGLDGALQGSAALLALATSWFSVRQFSNTIRHYKP
jgi:MFS family permease